MSVALLANVPEDERTWLEFAYQNYVEHIQLNEKISNLYAVNIPLRAIDVIPENPTDWLTQHAIMHLQAAELTGATNYNFETVDFDNEAALKNWILLHYQQHLDMNGVVGS